MRVTKIVTEWICDECQVHEQLAGEHAPANWHYVDFEIQHGVCVEGVWGRKTDFEEACTFHYCAACWEARDQGTQRGLVALRYMAAQERTESAGLVVAPIPDAQAMSVAQLELVEDLLAHGPELREELRQLRQEHPKLHHLSYNLTDEGVWELNAVVEDDNVAGSP